jgi:hypothetical protein
VTAAVLLTKKSSAASAGTTTTTTTTTTGGTNTGGTLQNNAPPAPPSIPAIPFVGQTQSQLVTAPNIMYTARAVQGGAMQLTFPNQVVSVSADASYTSQQTSGNTVNFVLSGQSGTIIIKWGTGATTILVQVSLASQGIGQ